MDTIDIMFIKARFKLKIFIKSNHWRKMLTSHPDENVEIKLIRDLGLLGGLENSVI